MLIIVHYHGQKQRKTKIEPRIKLKHKYTSTVHGNFFVLYIDLILVILHKTGVFRNLNSDDLHLQNFVSVFTLFTQ